MISSGVCSHYLRNRMPTKLGMVDAGLDHSGAPVFFTKFVAFVLRSTQSWRPFPGVMMCCKKGLVHSAVTRWH